MILAPVSQSFAAKQYAPEIKEYVKKVAKQRKSQEKLELEEKFDDEYRKARPYQTLAEINKQLDDIIAKNPDIFSGGVYGKSVNGNDLRWVRMNTGPGDKVEILISGNIHAHELAAGQMVLAILQHFADKYGKDLEVTRLVENADIYFIPILNPDNMDKAVKMQAKYGITTFIRKNVNKVDLNRNFPYPEKAVEMVKDSAGSPKKISQTYRGPKPFSEPEVKYLIDFVDKHDFLLSLNYHTTGGLLLYVPGTYPDPEPDTELMKEMAQAYQDEQFDKYSVQPAIDLYPTLGAMDDYLYHRYGMLSFTVEIGTNGMKRGLVIRNGTFSPIFWTYNVYYLEREKANNVPGALVMIGQTIKIYEDKSVLKWEPEDTLWVGEPAR